MRKLILLLWFAFSGLALAQTTTVSGTVTDSDSIAWQNGTISFTLTSNNPNIPPTVGGVPLTAAQRNFTINLDGTGSFSTSVSDTNFIQPISLWSIKICSNTSAACATLTNMQITGSSQNITGTIAGQIQPIRLAASYSTRAYADVEITPIPPPGGTYYNTVQNISRQWNGTTWVNQGSGGSSGLPLANLGDTLYGGAGGTPTSLPGPTAGTIPYIYCSTPASGIAQAPVWCLAGIPGRTVTTGPDTIVATDRGGSITYNSPSPVPVSLTSAASLGNNFDFIVLNLGAGTVTITPVTGTINGNASVSIPASANCGINSQDNINYVARCGTPGGVAGVASFNTRTGLVTPASGDYTAAQVTNALDLSNAAQQTMVGNLALPNGSAGTSALNFGGATTGFSGNSTTISTNISGSTRGLWSANGLHFGTNLIAFGSSTGSDDVKLLRSAANIAQLTQGSGTSNGTLQLGIEENLINSVIPSAATIAPTSGIAHVSGTTTITTITIPAGMSATEGGCIQLIADGAWATNTGGNITTVLTAVVGTLYRACYDGATWYIK